MCVCVCAVGCAWQWTSALRNVLTLRYKIRAGTMLRLIVEAWDEDLGSADDLIGAAEVNVSSLVGLAASVSSDITAELWDEKGSERRGVILLHVTSDVRQTAYVPLARACSWEPRALR